MAEKTWTPNEVNHLLDMVAKEQRRPPNEMDDNAKAALAGLMDTYDLIGVLAGMAAICGDRAAATRRVSVEASTMWTRLAVKIMDLALHL